VRTLTSLLGNSQRLDGGAMFGNAPRALWSQWIPPDERHRIPLSCRCLLVRDGERHLLFEAGIGAFFDPKLKDRYGVVEDRHVLLDSLAAIGLTPEQIDVVVFSHLHFDHAGGALSTFRPDAPLELAFPRATFVVGKDAWERAQKPHPRDRASFVPRLQELLAESGRLELVSGERARSLGDGFRFHVSNGHTPGLLLSEVDMPGGPVVFAADLIPGRAWVHLPITMGYDRYPEMLIEEKQQLLDSVIARKGRLFYTHDHEVAMSRVSKDSDGRYRPVEPTPTLRDLAE
jgi:glyoxylase-like metal-dependent hydrolase (beta-lactamase superfamily II)